MIISVEAISDAGLLAAMQGKLPALTWRDGRKTAGAVAARVKRNEQAVMDEPAAKALAKELGKAVGGNAVVKAAARPRKISPLLISKTMNGGHYGAHIDNAIMESGAGRLRSDISFTLFLSDPESYSGGELVIHHAGGMHSVKGRLGELVLYPSTSIHEVTPVTSGERIVCAGWIESLVPDSAQREALFDLENLRASLRGSLSAGAAELLTLDKTIANLLRMWAQP